MTRQSWVSGYKVLILAVLFSFAWHLFCLSIFRIGFFPEKTEKAKFSKVTFLGPILNKSNLKVQAQPSPRTFLEKRYVARLHKGVAAFQPTVSPDSLRREGEPAPDRTTDGALVSLIDNAIGRVKAESDYGSD